MTDKWEQVCMCQVLQASGCSGMVSTEIDEGDEAPPRVPAEKETSWSLPVQLKNITPRGSRKHSTFTSLNTEKVKRFLLLFFLIERERQLFLSQRTSEVHIRKYA